MPVQEDRTETEKLGQLILQIKSRFDSGEIDGDSFQAEIERASKSYLGLWQKHIDEDIRQQVLDEVDDDEYLSVLKPLLQQKRRSTKAANDYELNQKLVRFAVSRGFTFDIIRQCLDVDEEDCE